MTTRRQHYVWQKYLEGWATDGKARQIWCLRRSGLRPFQTNTVNVGQERDFYRLTSFRREDAEFINLLGFTRKSPPPLKRLNDQWLSFIEMSVSVLNELRKTPDLPADLLEKVNAQLIEQEENVYGRGETRAALQLAALRAGDVGFLQKGDGDTAGFYHFLTEQYFRTKRMREVMRSQYLGTPHLERLDRTWPVLRRIIATNVAWTLFANREKAPPQVVRAPSSVEFITGDQPVINTHAAFVPDAAPIEELELYYPLSPTHALIISSHTTYQGMHGQELTELRASYLNQALEHLALEQLYASREESLLRLTVTFCEPEAATP